MSQQKNLKKKNTCLGKSIKKHTFFSVPIEKEVTRVGKNLKEIKKTISYKLQIYRQHKIYGNLFSNLVNNLADPARFLTAPGLVWPLDQP